MRAHVRRRENLEKRRSVRTTHVVGVVVVERELLLADLRVKGEAEAEYHRQEHDDERPDVGQNDAESEDEGGELHAEDFEEA